jgi:hypothetical protein
MTERDQEGTMDDPEVPEEDALEQRLDAVADEDEDGDEPDPEALAVEADPADVAEQSRSVGLDDDEYR